MARLAPSSRGSDHSQRSQNKMKLTSSLRGVTRSAKRARRTVNAAPLRRSARVQAKEIEPESQRSANVAARQTMESNTPQSDRHDISEELEDEAASTNRNSDGEPVLADENVDQSINEDCRRVIPSQPGLDFLYRQGLIRNIHLSASLSGMIDVDELTEELATFHGSYQNALTVNDETMYNATLDLLRIQLTLYLQFARHWNFMPQFTKAGEASHVNRKLDGSGNMLLPESMMPGVLSE